MEWARRKEVKYFPAKPSTVALWVADHSGHKSESDLLAMLEAIKRMHDAHGGLANPCSTCAVERMLAVVIKAEPPRSWPKAEKALFATLDPALRAIISKRRIRRERGLRQKQNELSAAIKAAEQRQSDGAETKPVNSKKENENGKEART